MMALIFIGTRKTQTERYVAISDSKGVGNRGAVLGQDNAYIVKTVSHPLLSSNCSARPVGQIALD